MKIIDAHTHVWLSHADRDRRELQEAAERVPLDRFYVSGLCGHDPDVETVVAINDAVAELLRTCPLARGQLYLNPRHQRQVADEFRRCRDLGFQGVKLWQATRADDPLNFPVYEMAAEHSMPVLLHSFTTFPGASDGQSAPETVAEVAMRYPDCMFQMAHVAGDFVRGAEAVAGLPNVVVDFSGSYGEAGTLEYTVAALGADHVVFGSDMPGSDIYHNLGKVSGADLPRAVKEKILFTNAERFLM